VPIYKDITCTCTINCASTVTICMSDSKVIASLKDEYMYMSILYLQSLFACFSDISEGLINCAVIADGDGAWAKRSS